MKSPFRCRCTKEPGDSFCMVHPICNHCGEKLDDFVAQADTHIIALMVALHVESIEDAYAEIARLRRIDAAAKALVSTMGAST